MGTGIHAKDRIGVERVLLGVWMVVVSMRCVNGIIPISVNGIIPINVNGIIPIRSVTDAKHIQKHKIMKDIDHGINTNSNTKHVNYARGIKNGILRMFAAARTFNSILTRYKEMR